MPASLSDASSTQFVGCKSSDTLAPADGSQLAYAISVSLGTLGAMLADPVTYSLKPTSLGPRDQVISDKAAELNASLIDWSNNALAPTSPDAPAIVDHTATILALTADPAAFSMTCGELVATLGQRTSLAIVQLKRISVDTAENDPAQARGDANDSAVDAEKSNTPFDPLGAIKDWLGKVGVGIGVALVVVLVLVGVWFYIKER